MIAKAGKPHTIGEELILPAAKEIIETVMEKDASSIIKAIPLSNNTVQRRIDEMGSDVQQQLVEILQTSDHALQIDESTLSDNSSLLLGYVRFVHNKKQHEEFLFALELSADTKASSIFNAVKEFYLTNNIPMTNI